MPDGVLVAAEGTGSYGAVVGDVLEAAGHRVAHRPSHPGLHRAAAGRGQDQQADPALPQALRRTADLPDAGCRPRSTWVARVSGLTRHSSIPHEVGPQVAGRCVTGWPVSRVLSSSRRGDHPSPTAVAGGLQRSTRMLGRAALEHILSDLAPGGVYLAAPVAWGAGELLPHRFTLTCPEAGGLFSVALSRGSPRVAVSHHLALWSPDFPRRLPFVWEATRSPGQPVTREPPYRSRPAPGSGVAPSYDAGPGNARHMRTVIRS